MMSNPRLESMITFGTSGDKSLIKTLVVFGGGTENRKVQDLRSIQEPAPEANNLEGQIRVEEILPGVEIRSFGQQDIASHLSLSTPYFSDAWINKDILHNIGIGFSFNSKEFIKRNTTFPEASKISTGTLRLLGFFDPENVEVAPISIRVTRRKVNKDKRIIGRFGKVKYEVDESSKAIIAECSGPESDLRDAFYPKKINLISFLHLRGEVGQVDLYTTMDIRNDFRRNVRRQLRSPQNFIPPLNYPVSGYPDFNGSYQYGAEITMLDKTPQLMQNIIFIAERNINDLKQIVQKIISGTGTSDNTRYNTRNNNLNKPVGDVILRGTDRPLRDEKLEPLKNLMWGMFTVFSSRPETDRVNFWQRVDFAADTRNMSPLQNIIDFIEGYVAKVMQKLKKVMPTLEPLNIARGDAGQNPGNKNIPIITYEHHFDEIVDINPDVLNGIDFIRGIAEDSQRYTAFPQITARKYKRRAQDEVNKYFNGNLVERGISPLMADRLNPAPNAHSFLSPQRIYVGSRGRNNKYIPAFNSISFNNDDVGLMLAYLMKQRQDSTTENDFRPQPIHNPWVEYENRRPTSSQKITPVLEDILEESGCQVRYASANDPSQVTATRLGADAFFGALPNDEPSNIAQRQMLNDNLGILDEPAPTARLAPPLVGRALMTIASAQVNLTKDRGNKNFFDTESDSLAKITYFGGELEDIRTRGVARLVSNSAIKEPGVDRPENFAALLRDIPPQHQSLLAIQYARKIPNDTRDRELLSDRDIIYESVKMPTLNSRRSDEYDLEAEDSSLLLGVDEVRRRVPLFDPMKNKSKFANYWVNYKLLSSVEYLAGFDNRNLKKPVWKRLRQEDVQAIHDNEFGRVLCRLKILGDSSGLKDADIVGTGKVDLFNLPIYNEYFFLGNDDPAAPLDEFNVPRDENRQQEQDIIMEDEFNNEDNGGQQGGGIGGYG